MSESIKKSLVIFIAVGTPLREDGSADLSYIEEVARTIAKNLNGYKVIVTKSTVPVGTGKLIEGIIEREQGGEHKFDVVSNPAFLREGSAVEDFMRPNRVVLGARSEQAIAIMKDLYSPLYLIETPFVITDIETSELIKYASNAFLATKISFINEVATICERVGADVHMVAKGMGLDNRIGSKFLHAGPPTSESGIHFASCILRFGPEKYLLRRERTVSTRSAWTVRTPGMGHAEASGRRGPLRFQSTAAIHRHGVRLQSAVRLGCVGKGPSPHWCGRSKSAFSWRKLECVPTRVSPSSNSSGSSS